MSECNCGFLKQCSADSKSPIHQTDTGDYLLRLTPTRTVNLAFCFFCGGRALSTTGPCQCNSMVHWAGIPASCVSLNGRFGEFQIHFRDNKLIMYFCSSCGGRLPSSKRSEFFLEPSESEMAEFERLLRPAKALADVIQILGEPDTRFTKSEIDEKDKQVFGVPIVETTFLYTRPARTFDICAQEGELDGVRVTFLKKPKPYEP
jgi:hypothetical protein